MRGQPVDVTAVRVHGVDLNIPVPCTGERDPLTVWRPIGFGVDGVATGQLSRRPAAWVDRVNVAVAGASAGEQDLARWRGAGSDCDVGRTRADRDRGSDGQG